MGINVRTKGAEGEREVAKMLNAIVATVRKELDLPQYATMDELFQRNQNQSAVGGADLSNNLGLEIEVKRQEALSVNSWWKQCDVRCPYWGHSYSYLSSESQSLARLHGRANTPPVR
jgi:hypothetical protein